MKLLVGLGNPGRRYAGTRHNVGFDAVGRLAERCSVALSQRRYGGLFGRGRVAGADAGLLLPETYMNRSGQAVAEALRFLPVDEPARDVIVAYDDADLPLGRIRVRARGSAGGHRGLASVLEELGSRELPRLRLGIGRPSGSVDTVDWVLTRFAAEEREAAAAMREAAADALETFVGEGVEAAMNRHNAAATDAPDGGASDVAGGSGNR